MSWAGRTTATCACRATSNAVTCPGNGTRINGMQIGHPASWAKPPEALPLCFESYPLHDGDELMVGGTLFQVKIGAPVESDTGHEILALTS
jgi:hypothetical protein